MSDYNVLELEEDAEAELSLDDETTRYLELEVESEVNVIQAEEESVLLKVTNDGYVTGDITRLYSGSAGTSIFASNWIYPKNIYLPKCTTLNRNALSRCPQLVKIDLPICSSLGMDCFYSCYSLKTIILRQTSGVVSRADDEEYSNCYHLNGTVDSTYNPDGLKDGYIYVPDELVESYKTATNWSTYASQIKPLSELPDE